MCEQLVWSKKIIVKTTNSSSPSAAAAAATTTSTYCITIYIISKAKSGYNVVIYRTIWRLLHTAAVDPESSPLHRRHQSCLDLTSLPVPSNPLPLCTHIHTHQFNPLIPTLQPQSNGPLYDNTVIGTLAIDGLHLVQQGRAWAGWGPTQSPPRCTKCNPSTASVPTPYYLMWHYNCLLALRVNSYLPGEPRSAGCLFSPFPPRLCILPGQINSFISSFIPSSHIIPGWFSSFHFHHCTQHFTIHHLLWTAFAQSSEIM